MSARPAYNVFQNSISKPKHKPVIRSPSCCKGQDPGFPFHHVTLNAFFSSLLLSFHTSKTVASHAATNQATPRNLKHIVNAWCSGGSNYCHSD